MPSKFATQPLRVMLLRLLFSLVILPYLVSGQCPAVAAPCICSPSVYEPVSIVCNGADSLLAVLEAINVASDVKIDALSITNTPIPVLQANSFYGFNIARLHLNRNQLQQIDNGAFAGPILKSLTELDLRDNLLSFVPETGITQLRALRKLSLSGNRIQTILPRTFEIFESRKIIVKLDLSSNYLSDLHPLAFSGLSSLKEMNLGKNQFSQVPIGALRSTREILENLNLGINKIADVPIKSLDLPNLKSLSLEYNLLRNIVPEVFQGCPELQYLYVGGNKFNRLEPDMFRFIGQLKILGIGANSFETIPSNAFHFVPGLERLEMQESSVSLIEVGAFQAIPQVRAIILSKNQLFEIRSDVFRGLQHLYSLDLKGNRLRNVKQGAWANLPSLRHLDISSNELETLSEGTFDGTLLPTGDRRSLFIYENPWTCDARIDWFRFWLRAHLDMMIDTSMSRAVCVAPDWLNNWPLRQQDPERPPPPPLGEVGEGLVVSIAGRPVLSYLWWIILAIILAILLTSICLLAVVRYFVSRQHRRAKDILDDEERILRGSSIGSSYPPFPRTISPVPYPESLSDFRLPPATSFDIETSRPNYYHV